MAVRPLEPERFAELVAARTDENHDPVSSLCLACADVIGVTGAALMLVSGGQSLGCVGVSDDLTESVEQVEYVLGEGPCVDAFKQAAPVFDPDLAGEAAGPWPEFRRGALGAGVRAAFGFPLLVDWICIGAMNLYHRESGALTLDQIDDALAVAQLVSRTLLAWQSEAPPGTVAWQLGHVPKHRVPRTPGRRPRLRAGRRVRRRRTRAAAQRTRSRTIEQSSTSRPTSTPGSCDSTDRGHDFPASEQIPNKLNTGPRERGGTEMAREQDFLTAFVEFADTLVDEYDIVEFLHHLAVRCVELVDIAEAGIMLSDGEEVLHYVASSSERMRLIELFELQYDQGPCLDAFRTGSAVHSALGDEADIRWPDFAPHAREAGFASVSALPMKLRNEVIGALNIFSTSASVIEPSQRVIAQSLADIATIGILQERALSDARVVTSQLETALESRIVIEQAKGVVAERNQVSIDAAFAQLRGYARSHNRS